MIKTYNYFLVVVIVLYALSCNDNNINREPEIQNISDDSFSFIAPPKIVKILKDSVKKTFLKDMSVDTVVAGSPQQQKVSVPDLSSLKFSAERPTDWSEKIIVKSTQTTKLIPGKNEVSFPEKTMVPTKKQTEQDNGNVIFPPIVIGKKEIKPVKAIVGYKEDSRFDIQYFNEFSGMQSSTVLTMFEDSRGILWMGTTQGALLYNGVSFTQYSTENGLINSVVNSLFEDSNGNIWLGTSVGAACYNGFAFTHYTEAQGLVNNKVTAIAEDINGRIWIGTRNGISVFDGDNFAHYTKKQGLIGNEISSIITDKSGNVWIATSEGICSFDGNGFIHYQTGIDEERSSISALHVDNEGRVWFATWDGGLRCLQNKQISIYGNETGLGSIIILSIHVDENRNLWLGTFGQGVIYFDGKKFTQYTTDDGLLHNSVNLVIEDSSGKIWLGTMSGINRLNNSSFEQYTINEGLSNNQVLSIEKLGENKLIFGTIGGVSILSDDSIINIPMGFRAGDISTIMKDKKGHIWLGSEAGLFCYKSGSLYNYRKEQGLVNNWVSDIKEDKDGNLWIATWSGISILKDSLFINFNKESGLESNSISTVFIDDTGKVWFGTMDGGIICYDGDSFTSYNSSNGLGTDKITSIVQDNKGNLWFGSYGEGLYCYNGSSFFSFTTRQGLRNNFIESLIFDHDNRLWIATKDGISMLFYYSVSENFQRNNQYRFYNFGFLDGLKSKKFGLNTVHIDNKNRLLWGGQKGLTIFDLTKFDTKKEKSQLYLSRLEIQQQFIDFGQLLNKKIGEVITIGSIISKKRQQISFSDVSQYHNYPIDLELNYKLNELSFHFFGIDWQAPHKLQYQFMLKGFDNSWSFFSTDNKAVYKNLPSGTYTLKVRAVGEANIWSDILAYRFIIHPPWWLSWWAKATYIILFISSIGTYIRLRVASLKRSKRILEQKVKERTIEVEMQKEELLKQNEEIKSINTTLNEQKLIIEIRNESLSLQNEEILAQRDLLSKQNKAISESILYAKQIQSAVMPKKQLLDEIMPEYFILFKPRDVVSGDFYWIRKTQEFVIIIVADCTGHGVPGAFMSMLGISILNEIVWNKKITKANQALNKLRNHVKHALEQTGKEGEIDDGMDLALCLLNTTTNELQYAGANNSLYLIKDGNFNEIKADKMPIGYYPNEKPSFTNHEIQLNKGDTLYLFSDGFMDQFGGKQGFKFMTARFQQLLLDINIRPMELQEVLIEEELDRWMVGWEQTDDILVMGVRV